MIRNQVLTLFLAEYYSEIIIKEYKILTYEDVSGV